MKNVSLQKRLIGIGASLGLLISVVIFYSQSLVNRTANESIQSLEENREIQRRLTEVKGTLQTLQRLVYQFTLVTHQTDRKLQNNIDRHIDSLTQFTKDFTQDGIIVGKSRNDTNPFIHIYSGLALQLDKSARQLSEYIKNYIEIVNDPRRRFPGIIVLLEEMSPRNREFIQTIEIAVDELEKSDAAEAKKIRELFVNLRYAWSQQVSWFRLFVANRLGMFGKPELSMRFSLENRKIYTAKVSEILKKLKLLNEEEKLGMQGSESVKALRRIYTNYEAAFSHASRIFSSDQWRAD